MPKGIVTRLNSTIAVAAGTKEMRERYVALGAEPETSSPEQFAAYLNKDIGSWAKVVKAAGAKAE